MANEMLFGSLTQKGTRRADVRNDARGPAYEREPRLALAQYAVTGCFNRTFYATGAQMLERVLPLAKTLDPTFVAKLAVYARQRSHMKDMPALLVAVLTAREPELAERVFARVIDSPRMLRTFVQIVRSGRVGRRSFGTRFRRAIRAWLESRTEAQLVAAAIGASPSLADIVRMTHARPATPAREAFYRWLLDRPCDESALPDALQAFERFRRGETRETPDVPLAMLTTLPLRVDDWRALARRATWQTLRMNLNTFARHGVFGTAARTPAPGSVLGLEWADPGAGRAAADVATRLVNQTAMKAGRAQPHQVLTALLQADALVPEAVRDALREALEISLRAVPAVEGRLVVCLDVSGSMAAPITGTRTGPSTAVRCVDVAALVTAALVRRNRSAVVLPFDDSVIEAPVDTTADVVRLATTLASFGGGGTSCSAPLAWLNARAQGAELVVFVSDNQSWLDARSGPKTALVREWRRFKARNPEARLACIDVQPSHTVQAPDEEDVVNIGGFSDDVFTLLAGFAAGQLSPENWVGEIEAVEL